MHAIGRRSDITKRLLRAFAQAGPVDVVQGQVWYPKHAEHVRQLAERTGVDRTTAAAVVAVLSPRMHWSRNLRIAEQALELAASGRSATCMTGVFTANLLKVDAIVAGNRSVLSGPKVNAFAANLSGDLSAVTVDVHAVHVALGRPKPHITPNQYRVIADAYRSAAARLGIEPAELQAILWVAHRGRPD